MPGLSQKVRAPYKEAWPLTDRPAFSQINQASHREAGPLIQSLSLLHRYGRTSHTDTGPGRVLNFIAIIVLIVVDAIY